MLLFFQSLLFPVAYAILTPTEVDIPDRYIITVRPGTDLEEHLSYVRALNNTGPDGDDLQGVTAHFSIGTYQAYAGHFDTSIIKQLRRNKNVEAIEHDQRIEIKLIPGSKVTQTDPPYGLTLISHRGLGEDEQGYLYDKSDGENTYGYVVDTGIDVNHPQFGGRAFHGFNVIRSSSWDDSVGHGTHVAGIMGSASYGVSKRCQLIAVKVLNDRTGSVSDVQEGLDWAVKDIVFHKRQKRAVINLSLGGPISRSFNKAVDEAVAMGVSVVVAAGNNDVNVATVSPASADGAITVAATNQYRVRGSFSNYGPKISVFAPGVDILSTWPGGGTKSLSGTSMAAPYVAGLVLYLQGLKSFRNAETLKRALVHLGTTRVVGDVKGSPNVFAYNNGGSKRGIWW